MHANNEDVTSVLLLSPQSEKPRASGMHEPNWTAIWSSSSSKTFADGRNLRSGLERLSFTLH